MKRGREDTGVSKQDFEAQNANGNTHVELGMTRASDAELRRRQIDSRRAQHLQKLNTTFSDALQSQWDQNRHGDWCENAREYIRYAREIMSKFGDQYGTAMTFGNGDCGQLGHGVETDDDMIVKYPRIISALSKIPIIQLSCGGLHSIAITYYGEVYSWGCNDDGALGRDGDENMPAKVEGFGPDQHWAIQAVGGDCHTAVLTAAGKVFTWGSYKDKEGKPWCDSDSPASSFKQKQTRPYQIKSLSNVAEVRCGSVFNLARTHDGSVYSWGLNEMGQMGRATTMDFKDESGEYNTSMVHKEHLTPAKVTLGSSPLPSIKSISCGSYHSLFSTSKNGYLYTCGLNNYGQLGIGSRDNCQELQLVDTLVDENVSLVSGGTHHSVIMTLKGDVYTFGRGDSGQLGMLEVCETGDFRDKPHKVTFPTDAPIKMVSAGSNHTIALSDKDKVFAWGYGDMLALGNGEEKDETKPRELEWTNTQFGDAQILAIDAGGQHSAILAFKQ